MVANVEIQWILESGASHQMIPTINIFKDIKRLEKSFCITLLTGSFMLMDNMGDISLNKNIKLINVLHVSDYNCNLIIIHIHD